jgi:hypothetical protein
MNNYKNSLLDNISAVELALCRRKPVITVMARWSRLVNFNIEDPGEGNSFP